MSELDPESAVGWGFESSARVDFSGQCRVLGHVSDSGVRVGFRFESLGSKYFSLK